MRKLEKNSRITLIPRRSVLTGFAGAGLASTMSLSSAKADIDDLASFDNKPHGDINVGTNNFFRNLRRNANANKLLELKLEITSTEGFGASIQNSLNDVRINFGLRATIEGQLEGVLNGTDFSRLFANRSQHTNIHGVIETSDGENLAVKVLGRTLSGGRVIQHFQIRSYSETYSWINSLFLYAVGLSPSRSKAGTIEVYAFEEDPFNGSQPFADPDESFVDYANFPFNLEQLQSDPRASLLYQGEGRLHGLNAFGADVEQVFAGQVEIPEEGLRMNAHFSGPATGRTNGVIDGVNYLRVMPTGSLRVNSKIYVRTFEAETLLVEAQGASFPETGSAWVETSTTVSNLAKYEDVANWSNLGVGSTDLQTGVIIYNHFGFDENPL